MVNGRDRGVEMRISLVFGALALLMLIGAFWVPNRDAHPLVRRSQFVVSLLGLLGLANLTRDMVLPFDFDIRHLLPFTSALLVLLAVIVPAFRHPRDQSGEAARETQR
jgi:hypothetical protein